MDKYDKRLEEYFIQHPCSEETKAFLREFAEALDEIRKNSTELEIEQFWKELKTAISERRKAILGYNPYQE